MHLQAPTHPCPHLAHHRRPQLQERLRGGPCGVRHHHGHAAVARGRQVWDDGEAHQVGQPKLPLDAVACGAGGRPGAVSAWERGGLRRVAPCSPQHTVDARTRARTRSAPDPWPKGRYRLPSASKYDMFSTTATHGTCSTRGGARVAVAARARAWACRVPVKRPCTGQPPLLPLPLRCPWPVPRSAHSHGHHPPGPPTMSLANMRMPLATSMKASFWGVVTITAAENATLWHSVSCGTAAGRGRVVGQGGAVRRRRALRPLLVACRPARPRPRTPGCRRCREESRQ